MEMKSEAEVQAYIQMDGPRFGCLLMRNNSGALKDSQGRLIRFGLGNISAKSNESIKSSDLIGITCVTVTQDMVGQTLGVFTAVEVKEPGWKPSPTDKRYIAQRNFIEWVKSKGGFAGFAWSLDSFREILRR